MAGELERTERGDGVFVHARIPSAELHRFAGLGAGEPERTRAIFG